MRKFAVSTYDEDERAPFVVEYVEAPTLWQARTWSKKWKPYRDIEEIQTAYNDD